MAQLIKSRSANTLPPSSARAIRPVKSLDSLPHVPPVLLVKNKNEKEWKVIGQGSFSTVYVATLISTGERVAVKVLDRKPSGVSTKEYDPELSFLREKRIMSALPESENIVRFFGSTEWASFFALVFEYAGIGDLHNHLKNGAAADLTEKMCFKLLHNILSALSTLHKNSPAIVHRDISSCNVLLFGLWPTSPTAKLTDFNNARWVISSDDETPYAGLLQRSYATPEYVAPETWEQEVSPTPSQDIYALGILATELATALCEKKYFAPFSYGFSWASRFSKIAYLQKGLPPKWPDSCPSAFSKLIGLCLSPRPVDRPSAAELLDHKTGFY